MTDQKQPVTAEWLLAHSFVDVDQTGFYRRVCNGYTISVWSISCDWCYCSVHSSLPIVIEDRRSILLLVEALESLSFSM